MLRFAIIRSFEIEKKHPITGEFFKDIQKRVVLEFETKQIIKKLAKYLLAELPIKSPERIRTWRLWEIVNLPLSWTYPEIEKAMEDAFWDVVKELKEETIKLA